MLQSWGLGAWPLLPAPLGHGLTGSSRFPLRSQALWGVRPTPGPASGPHLGQHWTQAVPAMRLWPEAAAHGAPQPRAAAPVPPCTTWGPSTRFWVRPRGLFWPGLCCFRTLGAVAKAVLTGPGDAPQCRATVLGTRQGAAPRPLLMTLTRRWRTKGHPHDRGRSCGPGGPCRSQGEAGR